MNKVLKIALGVAMAFGMGSAQTVASKLKGMHIYMQRQDAGHQEGYDGMRALLQANQVKYGYTFEYAAQPLSETAINDVFSRLYKGVGAPKTANTIDILIFCQGEGDRNVAGNPFANMDTRYKEVNTHVRSGGGLVIVHAGGGREISWDGWMFGAKLMTDWFVDAYYASALVQGNAGHFSAGTAGTFTMDDETLPAHDSSTYFIRNILTAAKTKNGYGQPLITDQVTGEWYHFNGGKQYEDGSGPTVSHPNNKLQPSQVRGNAGEPDSGIGPAKIIGILTKIQGANYTPPGKGRLSVWGREVSAGAFDAKASAQNGRFVYFNPGHAGDQFTQANGWMGDFFFSTLRWVAKDDRGCTVPAATNYNSLATVNDGTCAAVDVRESPLQDAKSNVFGRVSMNASELRISVAAEGPHTVQVLSLNGETRFEQAGDGAREYAVPGLDKGVYMVLLEAKGRTVKKLVTLR